MSIPKIKKNVGTTFTLNYEVRIIRGGLPYFSLLEKLILEAKDTIHIQYYIFDDDQTGSRIISLLKDAAHRGTTRKATTRAQGSCSSVLW